jgi:hypothetical protein
MADHGPNYQGKTAYNFSAATGEAHMSWACHVSNWHHGQGNTRDMHETMLYCMWLWWLIYTLRMNDRN